MRTRFAGTATTFAAIALIASACASPPEIKPAPPATTEQAAPEDAPDPTPTPFVPDCDNIIDAETRATLEAEGFVLLEEHEQKLRVEQRVEAMFFDNGGVDCLWGIAGGGDSLVAFGYSEITPSAASAAQAQLEAEGYARSEEGADVVLSIDPQTDVMGVGDVFVFSEGAWFHSTKREAVERIRQAVAKANQ
jgi:hypothetical protein